MEIVENSEKGEEIFFREEDFKPSAASSVVSGFAHLCSYPFHRLNESLHYSFLPLHPGEYGQKQSKQLEAVRRILLGVFQMPYYGLTLPFAVLGLACHGISNLLNHTPYRIDRGNFSGELNKNTKVMTLNPRMYRSLPLGSHHGVTPANDRIDRLIATVRDNNPDLFFLPEMNARVRHTLRHALDDRYHFFFSNMGRRTLGFEASFFIGFRGELESKPEYVRFSNQGIMSERGFFHFKANQTHYFCAASLTLQDLEEMCARVEKGEKVVLLTDGTYKKESSEAAFLKEKGFSSLSIQETNVTCAHLYGLEKRTEEREGVFMKKAEGKTDVVSMQLPEKISEALSDKPMFLTKILA